jgi:hypothetical protein
VAGYANVKAGVNEVVDPRPDADLANVVNEAAVAEVRPNGSLDPVLLLTKLVNKGVLVGGGGSWRYPHRPGIAIQPTGAQQVT